MDRILKAVPLDNFRIEIETSGGVKGIFDARPYLSGSAFLELQNESYFALVKPAHRGIAWPNEQDLSANTIIADIAAGQAAVCANIAPPQI